MKRKYLLDVNDETYYQLINQKAVKHHLLPLPSNHYAIWDGFLTKKGELYFSLCSELTTSEYAKLVRLNRETKAFEDIFYTKKAYFNNKRTIRDSKIHTAISEMEDGSLIMVTHTTDKAPEHPAWLPNAFYAHPWTGYAGSHLMIYNPDNEQFTYLGIPIPRESLYGAVYSKKTQCYYALGYIKGHLYKINPKTMDVKDYGQVVERASYRLIVGADENIYFSTRNGMLMRIDVVEDRVVNLGIQLPHEYETKGRKKGYISFGLNGPDGRLYLATQFSSELSIYDPKTNVLEVVGPYKQAEEYVNASEGYDHLSSMAFDKEGVLYGTICHIKYDSSENYKVPASLMRWDILKGKQPEHLGIIGSVEKAIVTTCSMVVDSQTDTLFVFGTNHGNDPGDVLEIDLAAFRDSCFAFGPKCEDTYIQPDNPYYQSHNESILTTVRYWNENTYYCMLDKVHPVALWQKLGLDPKHTIDKIETFDKEMIVSLGKIKVRLDYQGNILDHEVRDSKPKIKPNVHHEVVDAFYPGRQYLAKVRSEIELTSGNKVFVSEDGLLVYQRQDGEKTHFGPVWVQGPLIDWVKLHHSDVIYGVAGDVDDLSVVFRFTFEHGIEWLGYLGIDTVETGSFNSPYGGSVAVSLDDRYLTIASQTTLPSLYIYEIGGK